MEAHSSKSRAAKALELEKLAWMKAVQEINDDSNRAEEQAVSHFSARGTLRSGLFGKKIAEIHRDRAKRIVDKGIELRRATLKIAPELATSDEFKKLVDSASDTIDGVMASIPTHLRKFGFEIPLDAVRRKDESTAFALKAHVRNEVELLGREQELQIVQREEPVEKTVDVDRRKVWVVHGRNAKARDAMFAFLRAIGLEPMEWGEALALTGKGTPYTGEVLDRAFCEAQAVVVLITGDDLARLGTRYCEPHDPPDETEPTPQARPNVLFEAGMAFGKYPDRTVLVHLGRTRPFSDVAGRNTVHIANALRNRQALADRLRTAGSSVKTEHRNDWHSAGDFDGASEHPDAPIGDETGDDDLLFYKLVVQRLKETGNNHYAPEIGSSDDNRAKRLVERGLLKPGLMGGYTLSRRF